MRRHKSIESLSSISSESSESESESGSDDEDSDDQSDQSKNSNQSNDGDDQINKRKKKHHKKRKDKKNHSQKQDQRKKSIKRQQTLRIDVNRQKTINPQDATLQRQRSKSIDSPQKIEIRSKGRQMTESNNRLNINKVQNDGKIFQFQPHSQNKILNQQRRLQKAKTININDNYLVYNSGGNSKQETNVDIDEDYNLQTNNSNNKTGSQTVIRQRKRSSVVSNISNESNTSQQQLFDKKYQQIGLIVNSNNMNQIPNQAFKTQVPNINILSAENEEVDQLKQEKQDLKNQLVQERKRQTKLELINNSLAREYDQQNQLLNNINNKLDLKANNNQIILSERNYLMRTNQLSAFTRQVRSKKNSCLQKIVNTVSALNPFKSFYKKINQKIGDSAIIYFEFVTYLIFLHLIIVIAYMYFFFDYLINSSQKFDSNYQSFVSYLMSHNYTSNTHVSYTITFILMVILQILMNLIKYLLQAREEVAYKAQYSIKLKAFRLVFNSWDMNIQQLDYVERMKITLTSRIKNFMHFRKGKQIEGIENDIMHKKNDLKTINGFQKMLMIVTIVILNVAFVICSLIITSLIINSQTLQTTSIIFVNQMLQSLGVSITAYTSGYFLKILTVCESWFHTSFKNIHIIQYFKMLFAHLLVLALYIYLNISQIKYSNDVFQFLMFKTVPFYSQTYSCPEEQFCYSLLSLIFAYSLTCLFIQYLPTIKSILFNFICTPSRTLSQTERSFYNLSTFNPLDNLIPLIILNILAVCVAPLFPFVFIVTTILLLLIFFHNYYYIGRYKMASFEIVDKHQCRNLIIQFYTLCNVLAFIFFGFLLSLDYTKMFFNASESDIQRTCGSFSTGETPLSVFQSYLNKSSFIGNFYEFINFRPFLWAFLLLFLFAFLIKNSTQQEWKNQYQQQSKELDVIKNHYQQQLNIIQEKITSVRQNVNNNISPKNFYTPPNSKQTLQRDSNQNSTGKNSPINMNTPPQMQNQNGSSTPIQGGSGQLNSQTSLNNMQKDINSMSRPSLFQRTHKQSATYVGIGNLANPLDSFSAAVNRFS
ncbi:hypothetical protein ABPG74_018091 [Tetrahymena malaccensis]